MDEEKKAKSEYVGNVERNGAVIAINNTKVVSPRNWNQNPDPPDRAWFRQKLKIKVQVHQEFDHVNWQDTFRFF